MQARIERLRILAGDGAAFGVNVFVPQPVAQPGAVAPYPALNQLTKPLRAAAAARGDADGMSLCAGTGHRLVQAAPAADIIKSLTSDLSPTA